VDYSKMLGSVWAYCWSESWNDFQVW